MPCPWDTEIASDSSSTVHGVPHEGEVSFMKHIGTLPAPLGAYIPSDFEIPWTAAVQANKDNKLVHDKVLLNEEAAKLGLPLCVVRNGVIEVYFFLPDFLGVDVKGGKLALLDGSMERAVPVTSPAFLAEGVAQLVQRPAAGLANSTHTIIELEATGQQVRALSWLIPILPVPALQR